LALLASVSEVVVDEVVESVVVGGVVAETSEPLWVADEAAGADESV
jgi:hypothetical protein